MKMNSSGKVLTIFLFIIAFLLISLTLISVFLYQKEIEQRKVIELALQKAESSVIAMDDELKKVKKENFLLQEKNKEADEKINDISDELELEKGLREEVKLENAALKDSVEKLTKSNDELTLKLSTIEADKQKKIDELMAQLKSESDAKAQLESRNQELESKLSGSSSSSSGSGSGPSVPMISQINNPPPAEQNNIPTQNNSPVDLDKIVVTPSSSSSVPDGRILTVDAQTEFVIVNLGEKDGIKMGNLLAVYRGQDYLGDIKVTSVQPEMSAADLIPPFSSREVRKNDQVVFKQ